MRSTNLSRRGFIKGMGGLAVVAGLGLVGCGGGSSTSGTAAGTSAASGSAEGGWKAVMCAATGGINDQSFNQSAWAGMQALGEKGWDVSYIEAKQQSDYPSNLDKAVDAEPNLVWGIGFDMADALVECASKNPDVRFGIIDNANPNDAANITGVMFRAQESCFMVGYVAGRFSKTGKVGFVGGIASDLIDMFEWGFKAGVAYAGKETGATVTVDSQYAETFSDSAKGKSIAQKMLSDGCDIVFHAAGGTGTGAIEAAKEAGKYAIGVDMDQSYLAPDNVLTSALKRVDKGLELVSEKIKAGESKGGDNLSLGMTEECVGIPEEHSLIGDDLYNAALEIGEKIKSGEIVPPANEDEYNSFVA